MIISRCCKEKVYVEYGHEGSSFYVCSSCHVACDTLCSIGFVEDSHDDTGNVREIEKISGIT